MTYSTSRDEPIFVPLHGKAVAAPLQHLQTQGGDVTLTAPEADSFTLASLEPTAKALDGATAHPLLCCRTLPLTTAFAEGAAQHPVMDKKAMKQQSNSDAHQQRMGLRRSEQRMYQRGPRTKQELTSLGTDDTWITWLSKRLDVLSQDESSSCGVVGVPTQYSLLDTHVGRWYGRRRDGS